MLNSIKMAGLAVLVSLGGLASFSAPALAQSSFEVIIGPDGARVRAGDYCERNPWYDGCRDWRRGPGRDRGPGYDRGPGRDRGFDDDDYGRRGPPRHERRSARFCSPNDALNKADRMGIRRARIVSVGQRTIQVAGRDRGRTVIVRFGRGGGCPIVG